MASYGVNSTCVRPKGVCLSFIPDISKLPHFQHTFIGFLLLESANESCIGLILSVQLRSEDAMNGGIPSWKILSLRFYKDSMIINNS